MPDIAGEPDFYGISRKYPLPALSPSPSRPQVLYGQQDKLTLDTLASATPDARKKMIGERLFPLILKTHELNLAVKITDKLLESDNSEFLLHLLESPEALSAKIQGTLHVLSPAQKKGEKIDDTESLEEKALSGDKKAMEELKQRMREEGQVQASKNGQQAGNADKKDAEFSHRIEEGQEQQQKKKFHLTPEAKETLREAVLSAIHHPQGTVDPDLLQRCIAEGLPETAVLNAAVVARQRDAKNRERFNLSWQSDNDMHHRREMIQNM